MRQAKPENIFKLTPEQMKIYQRWVDEDQLLHSLMERGFECLGAGNTAEADMLFEQAHNVLSPLCEHSRSIWSSCHACDEIEAILFPDLVEEDE